jgi:uncharacterized protein (TIGR00730 family)
MVLVDSFIVFIRPLVSAMRYVCVFCGSSPGRSDIYLTAARGFGRLLVAHGLGLVYGGGHVGLMGALADAVLEARGQVVGVLPGFLVERELAHPGLTELVVVESMHARKQVMADRADAFVALPGGFGTADELCEILTWRQLHLHHKPIGLLNVNGYFDAFLAWLNHAAREELLRPTDRAVLHIADQPGHLLDWITDSLKEESEPPSSAADVR